MRRFLVALIAGASIVGFAAPSFATFPARGHEATTFQQLNSSGGSGTAVLTTIWDKKKICFNIDVTVPGAASYYATLYETIPDGPIATFVTGATTPPFKGCIGPGSRANPNRVYTAKAELRKLIRRPDLFDIKFSTDNFPGGALDGVLHKGTTP